MRLSVLDQSPIPQGSSRGDALRNTIELAQLADRMGYHRYWLAEHHGTPGLACNSPEVMLGPVAASTHKIRVGTGGIMLPHYSAFKVGETFAMLAGLYPGRIDLGLGRAPGSSQNVARMLQRDRRQPPLDDFREQLTELLGYFPQPDAGPEMWLLGSSPQSAVWAGELGLPYCFADFIQPWHPEIARFYREQFRPSTRGFLPQTSIAVWALCAETDELAFELSMSFRMMMTMLFRGRPIPVPTIDQAHEFFAQEGVPPDTLPAGRRILTGTPDKVYTSIQRVAKEYEAEEVLVVNIVHDHAARMRSYELLALQAGSR